MSNYCPNIKECRLVTARDFVLSEAQLLDFLDSYCKADGENWKECTRYIIKNNINFCPDFILPNTKMTPDEVIDKFDEENV